MKETENHSEPYEPELCYPGEPIESHTSPFHPSTEYDLHLEALQDQADILRIKEEPSVSPHIQVDPRPQELQDRQKRLEQRQLYPHEKYAHVQRRRMNPTIETTSLRKRLMRRIGKTK